MRTFFLCAALAACALAQDTTDVAIPVPMPPVEWDDKPCYKEAVFGAVFRERDGKLEVNLPFLPQLKWTVPEEQDVGKWVQSKEDEKAELEQQWMDALETLKEAVRMPVEKFLETAEKLKTKEELNDMNTAREVISWMADNTFIDGASLRDINPNIEDILESLENEADNLEDRFRLRAFSATPRVLQDYRYFDDYYCDGMSCCTYDGMSCWSDWEEEKDFGDKIEDAIEALGNKVFYAAISYGYDPVLVNNWFENRAAFYDDNQDASPEEIQANVERDIAQAQAYIGGIIYRAAEDIKSKLPAAAERLRDEVDRRRDEAIMAVQVAAQQAIDEIVWNIQEGAEEIKDVIDDAVCELTGNCPEEEWEEWEEWEIDPIVIDDMPVPVDPWVSLAKATPAQEAESNQTMYVAIGLSTVALAGIAIVALQKKNNKAQLSEPLLDETECKL